MAGKVVYVELVAQVKKFNAGMKKADAALAKTKRAVGLVSAAIVAVGVIAFRQMGKAIGKISQELDELSKTARALDSDFKFFEDMQFVFKRLGATGGVGALKKTMLAVSKAAGEAATGSAEYVDEFKVLNLNVEKFNKLSPEARILALQDAYSKSNKSVSEQNALQIIAGRGAKQLLNFFSATTDEVDKLIEKRRELGGFTEEAGSLAESFEDVKANTEQAVRALKNEIFLTVGPAFKRAAETTQEFVIWLRETGLVGPVVVGFFSVLAGVMAVATAAMVALAIATLPISATMLAVGAAITGVSLAVGAMALYWDELAESIEYVLEKFNLLDGAMKFGGQVLDFFGINPGTEGTPAGSRLAPSKVAPSAASLTAPQSVSNASIVNNYSISGQTAEQMQREANRRTDAQRRGSRK